MTANKLTLYLDMDGVLVDFESALSKLAKDDHANYVGQYDNVPGIFALMEPMPGAIEAVEKLRRKYDLYILSSSPWENPTALGDKLAWVKKHFGGEKDSLFYKKVIFSSAKNLSRGDILIDDRTANGAGDFEGEHILFGSREFPDWEAVLRHLL